MNEIPERRAPQGKFLAIGVDTFADEEFSLGQFENLAAALRFCAERTEKQQMLKIYIYDDCGKNVGEAGSF